MENNLYQAPESELETNNETQSAFEYTGPKSRPIGESIEWVAGGFSLFKESPGPWILTLVVGLAVAIVINLIPLIGFLVSMLTTYVWMGGLMLGCQAVSEGEPFDVKYLFAGFSNRPGALIGLSAIYSIGSLVIMFGSFGGTFFEMMSNPETAAANLDSTSFMLSGLISMALIIPLLMMLWFAPILVVLQNMSVIDAMKASFMGCLKNVLPFLIYGIIFLVLYILGAIPLLLGLLVVVPMLFGSIHASYQRIFLTPVQS